MILPTYGTVQKWSRYIWKNMKSKDVRTLVKKNKYKNGDGPAEIYRDWNEVISKRTILICR